MIKDCVEITSILGFVAKNEFSDVLEKIHARWGQSVLCSKLIPLIPALSVCQANPGALVVQAKFGIDFLAALTSLSTQRFLLSNL